MTTEPTKCPTCGRRPSERHGDTRRRAREIGAPWDNCPDPIHDLADLAPEMAGALVDLLKRRRTVFAHVEEAGTVAAVRRAEAVLDCAESLAPERKRGGVE